MRRAVASGTLQPAVADGKAVERKVERRRACGWSIGGGGKGLIRGHAQVAGGIEGGGIANWIVRRRADMAGLAIGLHDPADAAGGANVTHVAVAALALHLHRAVARDRA